MKHRDISIISLCLLLLVGCGSGSSDETSMQSNTGSDNDPDTTNVLTGVFVDSAVEGITFATATQDGTTNTAGEYTYLAGETITFSIGETMLPTVDAAPRITPIDLASGSDNPDSVSTNIARLLQSLDSDGNPENGITISSEAAANSAPINFDVSTEDFASNTDVINLVANAGSAGLISAEDANAHLQNTLGNTEDNSQETGSASAIAGFYDSTVDGGGPFYLLINTDGSAIEYEFDENQPDGPCYRITGWTFVSLGSDMYRIERPRRDAEDVQITRSDTGLSLSTDSYAVTFTSVTEIQSDTLQICN